MAITKTWEVNTLQRELSDGYVTKVIYRVNGTDGTYSTRATGEVDFPKGDSWSKPSDFVAYKDLTQAKAIEWVKAKLGADQVAAIEKAIDDNVTLQKTPVYGVGTPWG